jgi:hypothetical protein
MGVGERVGGGQARWAGAVGRRGGHARWACAVGMRGGQAAHRLTKRTSTMRRYDHMSAGAKNALAVEPETSPGW